MLATLQRSHARGRHRNKVTPEPVHVSRVEPSGAGQQFRWIDQVGGAPLVNEDLYGRVLAHERSGHASMVEMDVGQQDLTDIRSRDSFSAKGLGEVLMRS